MGSKGWGVVTQLDLEPGTFVAEYLGECCLACIVSCLATILPLVSLAEGSGGWLHMLLLGCFIPVYQHDPVSCF
jgi:hypothetical protein